MRKGMILFGIGAAMLFAQSDGSNAESKYSEWMKSTPKGIGAIKSAIAAKDDATVKTEADKLAGIYEQVADFWKEKGKADAVKLADATRDAAKAVSAAHGTEAQTAALQQVQQTCRPCHSVYREGDHIKM